MRLGGERFMLKRVKCKLSINFEVRYSQVHLAIQEKNGG